MLLKPIVISLSCLSCAVSWAAPDDYQYYAGTSAGLVLMDTEHPTVTGGNYQEGSVAGAELGFRAPFWQSLEFRVKLHQGVLALEGQDEYELATWVATDALFFLPNRYNYLFVGSHYQNSDALSQPGYQLGAGARYPLGNRWALTGEAQALYGMDVDTWDLMATVGVQFFFGAKPKGHKRAADDDQDGVLNPYDRCPNTPAQYSVDDNGCTQFRDAVIQREVEVLFEHDDDQIPARYYANVKTIADLMKQHPQLEIEIQGHTSLSGSKTYNKGLSERRARAVQTLLIEHYQIAASRIRAKGYGEEMPVVAPEKDAMDAAKNRRILVEMKVKEALY